MDQDCDTQELCWADADGDTFGSTSTTTSVDLDCLDAGESGNDLDCDDAIATCTTDCTTDVDSDSTPDCADGCLDADGDNFGVAGGAGNTCTGVDCDDNNMAINPGASEICDDMIDNDCDGLVDLADVMDCGQMVTECQTLGNDPSGQLDQDVWTFTGSMGEDVTLTLTAQGNGVGNAQLLLVAAIAGVDFSVVDTSSLPNGFSATLPADGEYRIGVIEQPPGALISGPIFSGDYCFTLDASQGGSTTLTPTASVE